MHRKPCGIVYRPQEGPLVYLPLDEVWVQAVVIDVSAKVTLSQVFVNASNIPTGHSKYVFPVPARAAVCAFEIVMEDGQTIVGVAKEKQQAVTEHGQAVRQGKVTSLVEWATDDVFTISIGSIPAEQRITTKLTYTINLMNDDLADQIRFQLPMCVGMRYGPLPHAMLDASTTPPSTRVRIVLGIQTSGGIQSVTSPSHPGQLLVLPFRGDDGEPSPNRMIATYESPDFLSQDLVVQVQAQGLDEPRCFAEIDPKHGSVSFQLTMVPKLKLPPITSQEYIFLVDRSGSMGGGRIETAKRTLVMLLRSLPASGTTLNIFSFGSRSSKMFPSSLEYNQEVLTTATQHVDSMRADFGGTEICLALSNVFESRSRASPTAVFVLTDGEAHNIDDTIRTVADAVAASNMEAPLRVFTLGIGKTTSTAMCEGIARAGKGICLMATTSKNILGKCAKLVRASRTSMLKNITVDWGIPISSAQHPNPVILQAPHKIEALYPGQRLLVSAMVKDPELTIPQCVSLRGQLDEEGEPVEIQVPVCVARPPTDDNSSTLVNTLAAHRIITELEDTRNEDLGADQKKAMIVRIGEDYQLASRHTSFVAVGELVLSYQKRSKNVDVLPSGLSHPADNFPNSLASDTDAHADERRNADLDLNEATDGNEEWDLVCSTKPRRAVGPHSFPKVIAYRRPAPAQSGPVTNAASGRQAPLSSNPRPRPQRFDELRPSGGNRKAGRKIPTPRNPPEGVATSSTDTPVVRLVRLQAFDGSFILNDEFVQIVGKGAGDGGKAKEISDAVWATALAIAYFVKHLADQPELLDGLVEKATDFIQNSPLPQGVDLEAVLMMAKGFIG